MPQDQQTWESLKTLVADALELPVTEREQFLRDRCGTEPSLLEEAITMIAAYQNSDGVIDSRTDAWLGLGGPDLLALGGQRIGRYVLDRLLAEGAMAAVYVARQHNPDRSVALKLVRTSLPLIDTAHRFKREADALGRLAHPNIARIYEAGVHRAGKGIAMPFIAMEFVDGLPLTEYARTKKLSRNQRIDLMIKVAAAVHAAHQQAIIHRDLKPANVLVDATGEPKVLDFGIARIVGTEEDNFTWQTTAGVLLGTPGYMSPEQAGGNAQDVDVRSDVWSLGVLLHELLTDRLPVEVKNTSVAEVLKRIETAEPLPISRFDRTLRGDLETIVGTALTREKAHRYPSAEAFASDLRHVLQYEPISARPPSTWYQLRRFARRHRIGISFASILLVLLLVASIVSSILFVRARRERDRAQSINNFLQEILATTDPSVGSKDMTVLRAIEGAEPKIRKYFGSDPRSEVEVRSTIGWTYYNLGYYDKAVEHLRRACELRKSTLGEADPRTIDEITRLVTAIRWQYKPAEALEVADPARKLAIARLGEEHPSTLGLLDAYAGTLDDLGRTADAEAAYRNVVAQSTKVLGPGHPQTLSAMNNFAVTLINQAKWSDAETVLSQVLRNRSKTDPASRVAYITNRHNLATVISSQGRFNDALREYEAACAEAHDLLGDDHSTTLFTRIGYGDTLLQVGRADEALAVLQDVCDRYTRIFGPNDEQTLNAMHNLVSTQLGAKRFPDAETTSRKLLSLVEQTLPPDHSLQIAARQDVAMALNELGRLAEAEPMQRDVIERYSRKLGPEHPRVLIQQNNLATTLLDASRPEEALALLESVQHVLAKKPFPPLTGPVNRNLGRTLLRLKRYEEAETALFAARDAFTTSQNLSSLKLTHGTLAELYDAWGKPESAAMSRAAASAVTTQPTEQR